MPGLIIAAAIAALLAVLAIRAALFRPPEGESRAVQPVEADGEAAALHLLQMIRKRTVWSREEQEIETGEFLAFMEMLPMLYPETHRVLQRETVNTYALLYRWKGSGHGAPAVLMAHYDVVAADEAGWRHAPFAGEIEDGVIWGRGALDTKVTLAGILEAVERLIKEGYTPERDIYLSFTNNEESAGESTPAIVELFRSRGITPSIVVDEGGAVVGGLFPGVKSPVAVVGVAEKGISDLMISVESEGGHAATPPRDMATVRLARAIVAIDRHPFRAHLPKPTIEMLETLGRHAPFAYRLVFANLWLFRPLLLLAFTKAGGEMNAMTHTTVAVTMLEGSPGANVLASRARAVTNIRIGIGGSVQGVTAHIARAVRRTGAAVTDIYSTEPSPVSDTGCEAFAMLRRVIAETFPGAVISPYVMLGGSDSRHFAGMSPFVYRFSPLELTKEERESMHNVNEAVPVAKLKKCVEFYIRLIRSL
ncbi:MAG: M20/M25/M40 family metallo-hydrolase [Clostridia bacterium]|nr:M20/M25/M40 family metallo-hydrolase [Clostridia bacterium]